MSPKLQKAVDIVNGEGTRNDKIRLIAKECGMDVSRAYTYYKMAEHVLSQPTNKN